MPVSPSGGVHTNRPDIFDVISLRQKLLPISLLKMMQLLIHIYENKTFQDPWAHFEHAHLKKNWVISSWAQFQVLKTLATSDPGSVL